MRSRFPYYTVLCLACMPPVTVAQEATPSLPLYDFERRLHRFDMPGRLDEISGLAMSADGRLFGHDDERATVHEIDRATGEVGKRFSLGEPPIEDDFEGLAIVDDRFFLITSRGLLHEFREGADREAVPYRVTDTGLGATCEVEGLDYDAVDGALLLACKASTPERGVILVQRLPLDPARPRPTPIEIGRAQLSAVGVEADFAPSSVVVGPAGGIWLASATAEALIEVDRGGRVLAGRALSGDRHPQPEGLEFGPDGTLYIADEQNGQSARVSTYGRVDSVGAPR